MEFSRKLKGLLEGRDGDSIVAHEALQTQVLEVEDVTIDGRTRRLEYPPFDIPAIRVELIENARIQFRSRPLAEHARKRFCIFGADQRVVENSLLNVPETYDRSLQSDFRLGEEGVTYIFLGEMLLHYGHMLLESCSRMWVLEHVKQLAGANVEFVFINSCQRRNAVDQLLGLVEQVAPVRMIPHNRQCIQISRLMVPSPMFIAVRGYCHPEQGNVLRNLFAPLAEHNRTADKIYFSRRKLSKKQRSLINEAEIEKVFTAHGYEVVHPQELSFGEQIGLYSQVRAMAGVEGSAIHNTLLAGKCEHLTVLNVHQGDPMVWHYQQQNICRAVHLDTTVVRTHPAFEIEGHLARNMPIITDTKAVRRALSGEGGDHPGRKGAGKMEKRELFSLVAAVFKETGDHLNEAFYDRLAKEDTVGAFRTGLESPGALASVKLRGETSLGRFRRSTFIGTIRMVAALKKTVNSLCGGHGKKK
ncbi:glycosyltransferase 61 family protein [Pseudodesulfovibrio indicus]|uniref:glycosyltransferase family 61 protein n=1 Tax=Pseudodesulfovibrio indicus TaxID=1716143 RepID=UPI00292FE1FB|nr:glycosyltransferase 61 family protein [Pseudodesulfovibrio indicus]